MASNRLAQMQILVVGIHHQNWKNLNGLLKREKQSRNKMRTLFQNNPVSCISFFIVRELI
jgi:hypothetical protein